jgi:GT2 family glycosyltransferase
MMPKVGLVTVLFKSDAVLEGFFKSLSIQSFKNYHIYLIDNDPSDATDNLVVELANRYSIEAYTHVRNPANYGVAKGNNQGIELSIGNGADYVLLLNNDIEFYQTDLISSMVERAEKGEDMIIPKILYFDSKLIWMAGGKLLKNKGYTTHVGEDQPDAAEFNIDKHFTYAPTCFMLINKSVFKKVGLMDEKYFVYYDDTDFIYRAVSLGYQIYYMSKLVVLHKVSSSTGGNETLFSIYYVNRNRIYFIKKNFNGFYKISALLYTIFSRGIKLMLYNKQQRGKLIAGFRDGFKIS